MDEKIDKAVENLLNQAFRTGAVPKPDDALKLSQAILNLAHAKQLMEGKLKKQGAAA